MRTILAPIDFSEISTRVIAHAVRLARALRGRVAILHVVQPPMVTDSDVGTQMSAEYSAMASEAAAKRLAVLGDQLRADGVSVQTSHQIGFPGTRIIDYAKTVAADYIVLGSHGHGAFYDLMVGSTASRVLRHATCPVVVVPMKPRKNPARKVDTDARSREGGAVSLKRVN